MLICLKPLIAGILAKATGLYIFVIAQRLFPCYNYTLLKSGIDLSVFYRKGRAMKDQFVLNVIHRIELSPEYAEKVTGQGKKEDISRSSLTDESLEIFKLQQAIAHKNGIKTTIQMTYGALFSEEAIAAAKADAAQYGDEIGLTLLGLPCKAFREKYKTKDFCIWMFEKSQKEAVIDDVFGLFFEKFGFYPLSTGSYYMDAESIAYIKKNYPSVKCAVATCWEEGPKAYHTCNNSWYTFMDGGPWAPWIPSKYNTHVPAENAEEDCGLVAIPHLSRDLIACYDGNGSNFGTHPQNVLRGMIYENGQYPYLYNLIDQYRNLTRYNRGQGYNMMFVGPGWMNKAGRWEAPYELLVKSYEDGMAYYGLLQKEGKLIAMTMGEYADHYRATHTYKQSECALWRDILYGSDKEVFWYSDPYMRAAFDMNQGGALFDLRPYAAKQQRPCGIGTAHVQDVSYPFLIQMNYRAGYFTHYAGEGAIKSAKLRYKGAEADLCLTRTRAHFTDTGEGRVLTLEPVEIELQGLRFSIETVLTFKEGSGEIETKRRLFHFSDPSARVELEEYTTACYGTTEYPEPMEGITLSLSDGQSLAYAYKCRELQSKNGSFARADVPQVETRLTLTAQNADATFLKEGYAFSPMFTLGAKKTLGEGESFSTWLKVEKEN